MATVVLCPICGKPLKRHKRKAGLYRLYICASCDKEFFIDRSGKNYDCGFFTCCAMSNHLKCKECHVLSS